MSGRSRSPAPVGLGPYALHSKLGAGGTSDVWLATRVRDELPLAVKIITSGLAQSPAGRAAFGREIRAIAQLNHPAIVGITDYGVVDGGAARRSGGRLSARCPYLVMELAEGSVAHLCGPMSASTLHRLLSQVLSALGFTHAQGLLHRDVKPSNILVFPGEEHHPVYRIADFGLAYDLDRKTKPATEQRIAGTIRYMAPEQRSGSWRRFGPWTDLYALGLVAFELASGRPSLHAQLGRVEPEALALGGPAFRTALARWLERMVNAQVEGRFHSAADALAELNRLPPASDEPGLSPPSPLGLGIAPTTDATATASRHLVSWTSSHDDASPVLSVAPLSRPELPPLPADWRAVEPPSRLVEGMSPNVHSLRPAGLKGREPVMDELWRLARAVCHSRAACLTILQGHKGVGRWALARWLRSRLEMLGHVKALTFFTDEGPDALRLSVQRQLGGVGGSAEADARATRRALARLDAPDRIRAAVEELLDPGGPACPVGALTRCLSWLARQRPLLLLARELGPGDLATRLEAVIEGLRSAGAPVMCVVTRDAAGAGTPPSTSQSGAAARRVLEVPPLDESQMRALARELRHLTVDQEDRVVRAADGRPGELLRLLQRAHVRSLAVATVKR